MQQMWIPNGPALAYPTIFVFFFVFRCRVSTLNEFCCMTLEQNLRTKYIFQ